MSHSYTKADLKEAFFSALEMFNECLDSDICEDNVRLDFFVPENGIDVYERFCSKYFREYLNEPYKSEGYFDEIAAQAFVGEFCYGVLIREDLDFTLGEVLQVLLHEISHLYCTRNEVPGGHFFERYCLGTGVEDGIMNAGYAIWREAVADIMADSIMSEDATAALAMVKEEIGVLEQMLSVGNPDSKKAMSLIIAYIMISAEVSTIEDWSIAEERIRKKIIFDDAVMFGILKMVFEQLHTSPFWMITPDFIIELGQLYISLLSERAIRGRFEEITGGAKQE